MITPEPRNYRFELKYLVEAQRLAAFDRMVKPWLIPDDHQEAHGGYYVHSIYFDSPHFTCFHEKEEGLTDRFKVRLRGYKPYLNAAASAWFLEVKQRHDQVITKQRIPLSPTSAQRLVRGEPFEQGAIAHLMARYQVRPVVAVLYMRCAYRSAVEPDLRLTHDRTLRCSRSVGIETSAEAFCDVLPPTVICLEIKCRSSLPHWLTQVIQAMDLHVVTLSKYTLSIERCFGEARGRAQVLWRQLAAGEGRRIDRPIEEWEGATV